MFICWLRKGFVIFFDTGLKRGRTVQGQYNGKSGGEEETILFVEKANRSKRCTVLVSVVVCKRKAT